jgi:hypothetical protein
MNDRQMSDTEERPTYRCEDGHVFYGDRRGDDAPETLPCTHFSEGSQDRCRKMGNRFHGRSD